MPPLYRYKFLNFKQLLFVNNNLLSYGASCIGNLSRNWNGLVKNIYKLDTKNGHRNKKYWLILLVLEEEEPVQHEDEIILKNVLYKTDFCLGDNSDGPSRPSSLLQWDSGWSAECDSRRGLASKESKISLSVLLYSDSSQDLPLPSCTVWSSIFA